MRISISMHSSVSAFIHYWPSFVGRWLLGQQERCDSVHRTSVVTNGGLPCIMVEWVTPDNRPVSQVMIDRLELERAKMMRKTNGPKEKIL